MTTGLLHGVARVGLITTALVCMIDAPAGAQSTATPQPPAAGQPGPAAQPQPAPVQPQDGQQKPADAAPAPESPAPADAPQPAPLPVESAAEAKPSGIRGKVVDENGVGLAAATVQVVSGGDQTATTDFEGAFELALPPGSYELRIYYPLYQAQVFAVAVRSSGFTTLDTALAPENAAEVIVVEGKVNKRSEAVQLDVRRRAVTLSDSLSGQEIARTPDSSAADAVKRVVAVTVQGGKYVVLRGLGERYVTTLLNGAILPSPEPDRQAVPLDLFPSGFLSNLTVLKSYAAELPGTFGGGTMIIDTNSYPDERELKIKLSSSLDTETIGNELFSQPGGSFDFFGYDDGSRALPSMVPVDKVVLASETNGMTDNDVERIGESFSNSWTTQNRQPLPNLSLSANLGDTTSVGGKRLGYLATLNFGHKLDSRRATVSKTRNAGGQLEYREQRESVDGKESGAVGILGNAGMSLAPGHSINLFAMYTHTGESSASTLSGYSETDSSNAEATRLEFVERALTFTQLTGSHRLAGGKLDLRWQGNLSLSSRDEKDTRDLIYNFLDDGSPVYKDQPGSGERFFAGLSELSMGTGVDATVPLERLTLRAGAMVQRADRDFSARRFRFNFVGTDFNVRQLPPELLFSPEHIGTSLRLEERTQATDGYDASLGVVGAYSAGEIKATDKLRVIAGLRVERAVQELTPGSEFSTTGEVNMDDLVQRTDTDLLPTANAVYALNAVMNLRAAYSYTLARPKFRELAPFLFSDYVRQRNVSGNPDLETTRIHNADLRWEWFAGEREVFAVSGFYKRFVSPIEQVIVSAIAGDASFDNAESADAIGAEFEARTSLGRFSPALADFFVGTNVAVIRSNVVLTDEQLMSQTSKERPMQGQSPYVVNLQASYSNPNVADISLLYNVIGRRISDVGFDTLPDIYEQPFHKLDVSASRRLNSNLTLKLAASNLLNGAVELRQGDLPILSYRPGMSVSVGIEWAP